MPGIDALFGEEAGVLRERGFQLLLLANTFGPLGTALLSPLLDTLAGVYGVPATSVGLMVSAFTAPPIVAIPLAGVLSDRYGRKPVLVAGLAGFGTAGVALALTTGFATALALRFLQGVAFAGMVPVIITSIGDLYDGTEEAAAQGFRFTESGIAQTALPLLAGALVGAAWQYPFLLFAPAIPVAALVALRFEEPAAGSNREGGAGARALLGLASEPRVFAMLIARALPVVVWIGFLTYNSILVVRILGGSPAAAGTLVAAGSLAYALAASQAGRITARFESRTAPLAGANLLMGGGLAATMLAPALGIALVAVVATGLGFGVVLSLYRSVITGLAPTGLRGGLVSLAEALGRLTATVVPVAMGAAIGAAAPAVGFAAAVRWTGAAAGALAGVLGVVAVLAASRAPEPAR